MNDYSVAAAKIDPGRRPATRPDGSPDNPDRVEIGPTDAAFAEWGALGLTPPNLERMRQTRLQRLCAELHRRDYAGALMFDPLNIRYATDSSNMQVWTMHNPSRACFVSADGYIVLWDFHKCDHLSEHLPLIREVRHGAGHFYFVAGDAEERVARDFAGQVDALLRAHGGDNRRLAVDRMEPSGPIALRTLGIEIQSGGQLMEHARLIKGVDEINAMRCAIAACETAMTAMEAACEPGIAEVELWAVLNAENHKRGGEWIETRILSSGPRTNPWMQECGPRRIREGELLAYDTDMIGPYGMCADLSRTILCGDGKATDEQRRLFDVAHDHIVSNMELLKPGVGFEEIVETGKALPEEYVALRYGAMMHGVGLCDEFPLIAYPQDHLTGSADYVLQPGMTLCVEAYIGAVGGKEGVKLEDQVLIVEDGYENLTNSRFDDRLQG